MIQGLRTVIYPTPDLARGKAFYAAVVVVSLLAFLQVWACGTSTPLPEWVAWMNDHARGVHSPDFAYLVPRFQSFRQFPDSIPPSTSRFLAANRSRIHRQPDSQSSALPVRCRVPSNYKLS